MPLNPFHPDYLVKPLKILAVVGEQAGDVISEHGGDDIGVMNLLAADLEILHQLDELAGHGGGIVRHLKVIFQIAHPVSIATSGADGWAKVCGRVRTAMNSRNTWRLIHKGRPAWWASLIAFSDCSCNGAVTTLAYDRGPACAIAL